jgi:hypothetical protein
VTTHGSLDPKPQQADPAQHGMGEPARAVVGDARHTRAANRPNQVQTVGRRDDALANLQEQTAALAGDAGQREAQERRQVVPAGARLVERVQIAALVLVVEVRHGDQERVTKTGAPQHQRLEGTRRAAVAVEERVHRRHVVVQRQGLHERIVVAKVAAHWGFRLGTPKFFPL